MNERLSAAVIVAHPDDETLWAGGTILCHPGWDWFVACLCRKNDADRAPKFYRALECLNAAGNMADLDDGPEQEPLDPDLVRETVISLLPAAHFDLIVTHSPGGEYTCHRRHEEVGRAVPELLERGVITADILRVFAYEDGNGSYLPRPASNAGVRFTVPPRQWREKYRIITEIYGFSPDSFEARTTPRTEAFLDREVKR